MAQLSTTDQTAIDALVEFISKLTAQNMSSGAYGQGNNSNYTDLLVCAGTFSDRFNKDGANLADLIDELESKFMSVAQAGNFGNFYSSRTEISRPETEKVIKFLDSLRDKYNVVGN